MPGTFSPPPLVSDPDMHHGTCVTHVPWYMSGSLTSGFLWSRRRGKRSRHSWRMRNPQFCVSGKRPMRKAFPASLSWRRHDVTVISMLLFSVIGCPIQTFLWLDNFIRVCLLDIALKWGLPTWWRLRKLLNWCPIFHVTEKSRSAWLNDKVPVE